MSTKAALIVVSLLVACVAGVGRLVPSGHELDVSTIEDIIIPRHVVSDIAESLYLDLPNETALCLYGAVVRNRPMLMIVSAIKASVIEATPGNVKYRCERSGDYVGTAHSHPTISNPSEPCFSSEEDQIALWKDKRALLKLVFCMNYKMEVRLRDGRTWNHLMWATPDVQN